MDLKSGFAYQPTTPLYPPGPPTPSPLPVGNLGPLERLLGAWQGTGFNVIWRPVYGTGRDHFLELNLTAEDLEFEVIPGVIPNRGLLQGDLMMAGARYLQQISDSNVKQPGNPAENAGLHVEPGVWLTVPATSDPLVPASVARLGSIPHGTTILAQGVATTSPGAPPIPEVSITPFQVNNPAAPQSFPEQNLGDPSLATRTQPPGSDGITQAMLDNPNSLLATALASETIVSTTALVVSSDPTTPIIGGGTVNSAFLQGGPDGPNAVAARVSAIFWLMTREGQMAPDLLQYTQTVLLNFNGLSWPHVTVATLHKQASP